MPDLITCVCLIALKYIILDNANAMTHIAMTMTESAQTLEAILTPAVGAALVSVGAFSTVTMVEADVAETLVPAVEIVTEICFAPAVVPVPILTFNVVSVPPASEQLAAALSIVALHDAAGSCAVVMKLAPLTVMVMLM